MIETVAKGLADLKEKVVFVGGATVSLYLKDEAARDVRPTDDVDCVIELTGRQDFYKLEQELEKRGFRHAMGPADPICRWKYCGIKVDVMPSDTAILGFSNRWYKEGIKRAVKKRVLSQEIFLFPLPLFLAAKIEAFLGRGGKDFRLSHDMEDIVTVLDGQEDFTELITAPGPVNAYLKEKIKTFLKDDSFIESLSAHLQPDPSATERARRILDFLTKISKG